MTHAELLSQSGRRSEDFIAPLEKLIGVLAEQDLIGLEPQCMKGDRGIEQVNQ